MSPRRKYYLRLQLAIVEAYGAPLRGGGSHPPYGFKHRLRARYCVQCYRAGVKERFKSIRMQRCRQARRTFKLIWNVAAVDGRLRWRYGYNGCRHCEDLNQCDQVLLMHAVDLATRCPDKLEADVDYDQQKVKILSSIARS